MKKYNKLEKTFGPAAFGGLVMLTCALVASLYDPIYYYVHGFNTKTNFEITNVKPLIVCILFFLIGSLMAFSTAYTKIDYANKRIKYGTKMFGIIFIGKWTNLTSGMRIGLKKTTENWGAYSRTGRSTSLDYTTLKIYLYDSEGYEIIPIKKIKKAKYAEEELEKLSELLGVGVIE